MADYYGDTRFMRLALEQAALAAAEGEVPVGAVVVRGEEILAAAHNTREAQKDPLAHAECLAIQEACRRTGDWRLNDCTLYVTLEPCPMCAGAILNARIPRVVYGAADEQMGCVGSKLQIFAADLGFAPRVTTGVLAEESAALLQEFFRKRR